MQCKFCGYDNPPEANFCVNCGESIQGVKVPARKEQSGEASVYLSSQQGEGHVLVDPVGEVHVFSQQVEETEYGKSSQKQVLVWRFRVHVFDEAGNLNSQISVEMRGDRFIGSVHDGDIVKLPGLWRQGQICTPREIINTTLGTQVRAQSFTFDYRSCLLFFVFVGILGSFAIGTIFDGFQVIFNGAQESMPLSGCVLTIRGPFVDLMSKPDQFSQELIAVEPGKYTALNYVTTNRVNREESWFQIELEGRKGWIANNTFNIDGKSSSCP